MSAEPIEIRNVEDEADHRDDCYMEPDPARPGEFRLVIRSSTLGGCIRNLVAARMGIRAVSFGDDAKRRMNEGVIHEPHILAHLKEKGWETVAQQSVLELSIAGGTILIRGHSDAKVANMMDGHLRVTEAKTMGKDVYAKWKRAGWEEFRRYAYQFSSYMHTTGLPGLFAVKNRDSGEIDVQLFDEAPIDLATIKVRAMKIRAAETLPLCDPVMWGCQRYFIHVADVEIDPLTGLEVSKGQESKALPPAPTDLPPAAIPAVEELARAYHEAQAECAAAEGKRKEIGAFLVAALDHHHLKKAETRRVGVTVVERTDTRIDAKALRADLPDVAAKYEKKSVSRYPKVTIRDEEDEA